MEDPDSYTDKQQMAHDLIAPIRAAQTYLGFAMQDLDSGDAQAARVHAEHANEALNESISQLVAGLFAEESVE